MTSADQPPSVAVFIPSDAAAEMVAPTLASLPETLRRSSNAHGSIHMIDGRPPTWARSVREAVGAGAAGVFVLDPSVPSLMELDEMVGVAASIPVGLDLAWASNPGLVGLQIQHDESLRAVVANGSVGTAGDDDLISGAVDAVVAVSRLAGSVPALVRLDRGEWSVSAAGRWGAVVFRLTIVRSAAVGRRLEISAHADRRTWAASVPDPVTAAPVTVAVTGEHGTELRPSIYEASRRWGLRALAARVRDGAPTGDLADYRSVVEAITNAGRPHP